MAHLEDHRVCRNLRGRYRIDSIKESSDKDRLSETAIVTGILPIVVGVEATALRRQP